MEEFKKIKKGLKGLFGKTPKEGEPQAEEKKDPAEASVRTGREIGGGIELLKAKLPGCKGLAEENIAAVSQALDLMRQLLAGQHATRDVSVLDADLEEIFGNTLPVLFRLKEPFAHWEKARASLTEMLKRRSGSEVDVDMAKIQAKLLVLETEKRRLEEQLETLDASDQNSRQLLKDYVAANKLDPMEMYSWPPEHVQRVNDLNADIKQLQVMRTNIQSQIDSVSAQLRDLGNQGTLINLQNGAISEEMRRAINTTVAEYTEELTDFSLNVEKQLAEVQAQTDKLNATVETIIERQKDKELKNVITASAASLVNEMAQEAKAQQQTVTAQTATETARPTLLEETK